MLKDKIENQVIRFNGDFGPSERPPGVNRKRQKFDAMVTLISRDSRLVTSDAAIELYDEFDPALAKLARGARDALVKMHEHVVSKKEPRR